MMFPKRIWKNIIIFSRNRYCSSKSTFAGHCDVPCQKIFAPWFPMCIEELDAIANHTVDSNVELEADHPGFKDLEYRKRRESLGKIANQFRINPNTREYEVPIMEYTELENQTWGTVYRNLKHYHDKYACDEYLAHKAMLEQYGVYGAQEIPQLKTITEYLKQRTGFSLRPVSGLLSSRDFLNGLAFKIFFSTQYIRHHSRPLYTPEPDVCHELIGHVPMFADPDFANFSQEIGLASLGASDEEIIALAKVYWFTVEFGLCRDIKMGNLKVYGAGILSSAGEVEYAATAEDRAIATEQNIHPDTVKEYFQTAWRNDETQVILPLTRPLNMAAMTKTDTCITLYQHTYYVTESISDMKRHFRESLGSIIKKPFKCSTDNNKNIKCDVEVHRNEPRVYTKFDLQ